MLASIAHIFPVIPNRLQPVRNLLCAGASKQQIPRGRSPIRNDNVL